MGLPRPDWSDEFLQLAGDAMNDVYYEVTARTDVQKQLSSSKYNFHQMSQQLNQIFHQCMESVDCISSLGPAHTNYYIFRSDE